MEARLLAVPALLMLDEEGREMHKINHTVDTPLKALTHDELCPGSAALGGILARYR